MEGFLQIRIPPWMRRLLTRLVAIVPAAVVAAVLGNAAVGKLLIISQVIISLTLTFAVVPLVLFTNDTKKMKEFANPFWVKALGWVVALVIFGLDVYLVIESIVTNQFGSATNA